MTETPQPSTTVYFRLAIRSSPSGVMRTVATFKSEHASEVARHAAAICALSPGAQWRIETTGGRPVKVTPAPA